MCKHLIRPPPWVQILWMFLQELFSWLFEKYSCFLGVGALPFYFYNQHSPQKLGTPWGRPRNNRIVSFYVFTVCGKGVKLSTLVAPWNASRFYKLCTIHIHRDRDRHMEPLFSIVSIPFPDRFRAVCLSLNNRSNAWGKMVRKGHRHLYCWSLAKLMCHLFLRWKW